VALRVRLNGSRLPQQERRRLSLVRDAGIRREAQRRRQEATYFDVLTRPRQSPSH
jgi:hypothetical protein